MLYLVTPPQLRSAILEAADVSIKRAPTSERSRLPWSKIAGSIAALF